MNIVLDATTKSIVATLSASAATTNPDFTAAYADNDGTVFTEGANDGALNGTSTKCARRVHVSLADGGGGRNSTDKP